MMGPFLGVTLVPQTEVRNIMIPIFHDMMDWEQRKNGNFKQVGVTSLIFSFPPTDGFKNGQHAVTDRTLTSLAARLRVCLCVGGSGADG